MSSKDGQTTDSAEEQGESKDETVLGGASRRNFLRSAAVTGAVAGVGGVGGAHQFDVSLQDGGVIPEGPSVGLQQVADGPLQQPVGFETAPGDDGRRFIVDQVGKIYEHGEDGIQAEPFLDVSANLEILTAREGGFDERGLLGLAFHPDFQENGRFYIRYSAPLAPDEDFSGPADGEGVTREGYDHRFVLSELQATDDLSQGDPTTERRLLEIPEPQFNHNAGAIDFGPDGYLYVATGDGGGADDVGTGHVDDWHDDNRGGNGQDVNQNLLGGILRIDVDSQQQDREYGIPDDNPLVDAEDALPEYYAWGMRNPWRMSFDSEGRLFVADVGQNLWEEINVVERGGNYGWNVKEASHCFGTLTPNEPPEECPSSAPDAAPYDGQPLIDPILEYPHSRGGEAVGISVTGGNVYEGQAMSDFGGMYVFADWSRSFAEPQGRLFVGMEEGAGAATGNVTDDNATGNETGNATGNETGNATGNDTAGNATGNDTAGGDVGEWSMQELVVENSPNGEINRYVLAFGADADGETYVCTSTTPTVIGDGGVFKVVPPEEGEQISMPGEELAAENATGDDETADKETADNETTGNESG